MATTAARRPKPSIPVTDDSAAEPATIPDGILEEFRGEMLPGSALSEEQKAAKQNRDQARPFRQYQKKVIEKAGVRNTHQHRQLTSNCCGAVARLSALPDSEIEIRDAHGQMTTEYELQVIAIANSACETIPGEQVFTVTAMKLARAALELRAEDPDGSRGIAWVNDTREDEASVLDD